MYDECMCTYIGSIWTAPTSLKGHTGGFGIYTTRNLTQQEYFLATADGPAIPIYDPYKGPESVASERFLELFGSYWWANGKLGERRSG
jgi:hypothetical protein